MRLIEKLTVTSIRNFVNKVREQKLYESTVPLDRWLRYNGCRIADGEFVFGEEMPESLENKETILGFLVVEHEFPAIEVELGDWSTYNEKDATT